MGGRGSSSGIGAAGGFGVGGGGGGGIGPISAAPQQNTPLQIQQTPPNIVPTAPQAQTLNAAAFSATDTADYHDLYNGRSYFQQQNLSIDQRLAVINYLSAATEPGSLYSMSQNMNYALGSGQTLTANQKFVRDNLLSAMHNLGYNLNLTRYDHETYINGLLTAAGVKNADYSSMTAAQMKSFLVGRQLTADQFLSTSYNDFKNAPPSNPFTDRAVRIEYRAKASTQAMMPGNGPGGQLGEIVLAPSNGTSNNMKIVDVKYSGKMARAKGTQSHSLRQVTLVVEIG